LQLADTNSQLDSGFGTHAKKRGSPVAAQ